MARPKGKLWLFTVTRSRRPNWMPGITTKTWHFKAPIRPAKGPWKYFEMIAEKTGSKISELHISRSEWPAITMLKIPWLFQDVFDYEGDEDPSDHQRGDGDYKID